jgi:hypothetical protein
MPPEFQAERIRALRSLGFSVTTSEVMQYTRPTVRVILDHGAYNFHLEAILTQEASIEWLHGHDVDASYVSWTTPSGPEARERLETLLRLTGLRDDSRDAATMLGRSVIDASSLDVPAPTSRITDWPPYRPPASRTRLTPHGTTRNPGVRRPTFMQQVEGLLPSMLQRVRAESDSVRVSQDTNDPTRMNIEATVRLPVPVHHIRFNLSEVENQGSDNTPSIEEEKKEIACVGKPPGRMLDI